MFAQAYALCGNVAAAEDIVQDALIKLWVNAAQFNAQKGTANAYISRITHNCAMDYFRKNKTQTEELNPEMSDGAISIETHLAGQQQRQTILQTIDTLPDAQKEAVRLFYFHERSSAEVAASLKKSPKAVERLLSRARQSLESRLCDKLGKGEQRYG